MATTRTGTEYALALRLLDHQIEAPDQSPLANVDDIELQLTGHDLIATALLCGPGALGRRLPGRLGTWTLALWRRLTLDPHPASIRIPLTEVQDIGSAIVLTPEAALAVQRRLTLESWLRTHLIERIPGSGAEPGEATGPRRRRPADLGPADPEARLLLLSELLMFDAYRNGRNIGRVHEVTAVPTDAGNPIVGAMAVNGYTIGPRGTGTSLGYDRHPEHGPLLLRAVIRYVHRHDATISADHIDDFDPVHRRLDVRAPRGVET